MTAVNPTASVTYAVEGLDLNLEEALAAAIDAAQRAGRIIWNAAQKRRAAIAAAYAPTTVPGKAPAADVTATAATTSEDASPQAPRTAGENHGTTVNPAAAAAEAVAQGRERASKAVQEVLQTGTKTSPNDLVTLYDKQCDAVIVKTLQQYIDRVNHSAATAAARAASTGNADAGEGSSNGNRTHWPFHFITEELNPDAPLTDDLTWIVDPIDGTMSFVHGLPDCCVSIGLTYRKECILAVVFCPFIARGAVGVMQAAHAREALGQSPTGTSAGSVSVPPAQLPQPPNSPGNPISSTPPPQQLQSSLASAGAGPTPKRAIPQPPQSASLSATNPLAGASSGVGSDAGAGEAGVVECVGELYVALKGKGTFVNGIPVHVNSAATPRTAMAVFNMPYGVKLSAAEAAQALEVARSSVTDKVTAGEGDVAAITRAEEHQRRIIGKAKMARAIDAVVEVRKQMCVDMLPGVRAYGSCVTTLALLAAGHVDLYVEPAGELWDVVCGSLLIKEAGGCVRNLLGDPFDMARDTTIAAGATEALVTYATELCVKHDLGQYWLCS